MGRLRIAGIVVCVGAVMAAATYLMAPALFAPRGAGSGSGRLVASQRLTPPIALPRRPETDAEAARFLAQATFGPTLADIAYLRQVGYEAWLNEQFRMPPSYQVPYLEALGDDAVWDLHQGARMEAWFLHALGGQDPFVPAIHHRDQLRQRVAFALSEMFVASDVPDSLSSQPYGLASYYDVLVRNAFGNYRRLLEDVTLHPVMGTYLSMRGNQKPDPERNIRPDENFAREVMQLFSVGLVRLDRDGTPVLDAQGNTIPTYDQYTVKGFAHVFTGWTFDTCAQESEAFEWCDVWEFNAPDWRMPMAPVEAYHASAEDKQLLVYPRVALPGGVLPGGGTATGDLDAALDNLFNHPNVGPFVAKHLIQRLVTSNPSPAYVERVATVFDNGWGLRTQRRRGDLKAVVRAILMDPEARRPRSPHFGKVREPLLRLTHIWRALDARTQTGRMSEWWPEWYLGQAPLRAPSVFNFFSPAYRPTGELTDLGLVAPELQLATDSMLPLTNDALGNEVYWYYIGNPDVGPDDISVDLSRDMPLAANPGALLDRYNILFLSGQMSPLMRQILLDHLNAMPNGNGGRDRVQEALYLITNSPEYTVQK